LEPNEALLHNWFFGNAEVRTVACVLTAAFMGSIPFGRLADWFFADLDSRLASTARGFAPVLNVVKTFIPVFGATHGGGTTVGALAAVAAVAGDCYSPWFRFQGGAQGRAAQLGALAGLWWPAAVVFGVAWLVGALASDYAAIGTIFATGVGILTLWIGIGLPGALCALALFALVGSAHRANFERLLDDREPAMRGQSAA
jgi:glycerol-3-phosphate acyltransferase PlsY